MQGDRIVFLRSSSRAYQDSYGPGYDGTEDDLCWIGSNGGDVNLIDKARFRFNPHFVKGQPDRIYLTNGGGDLVSIKWDGTDEKKIAHVTGITTHMDLPIQNTEGLIPRK